MLREIDLVLGHRKIFKSIRDDAKFIDAAYRGILGRHADLDGIQQYSRILKKNNHDLAPVLRDLLSSKEFAERSSGTESDSVTEEAIAKRDEWIYAGYRAFFGRDPDPGGLEAYRQELAKPDHDIRWFLDCLISSDEFRLVINKVAQLWKERKPVCTLIRGGRRLWVDLHDVYVSAGCLYDNYEPSETKFILSRLKPGDAFLDIGANVGWFTILAADAVGPEGKIFAFEPRTLTFNLLQQSVVDNALGGRVVLFHSALGKSEGTLRLVWTPNTINPGGARLERLGEDIGNNDYEVVPVRPLDSLDIDRDVAIVKMDVEGAEPLVLQGGEKFLARCRPTILSEVLSDCLRHVSGVEPDEYMKYLRRLGYRVFELDDGEIGVEIADAACLDREDPYNCVLVHESRICR